MVPLYAARMQDLGPGDVAVFKCGACGHTAELPLSALIQGLGLKPTEKVLDLERRLRCRLCYARGAGRGINSVEGVGRWAQRERAPGFRGEQLARPPKGINSLRRA
jgi:hypothetical protein